jgi:hypothetical protein
MYYSKQTLYHKVTHKIVRLNPSEDNCSSWNWELGKNSGKTHLIDEDGNTFWDNINDYTNFEDFLGEPQPGNLHNSPNPYVDITLKKFLVFGEEREKLRKKELENICKDIFTKLDSHKYAQFVFKNSLVVYLYFKEKVNAQPIFFDNKDGCTFKDNVIKKEDAKYTSIENGVLPYNMTINKNLIFEYEGNLYRLTCDEIFLIELNEKFLKNVLSK